MADPFASSLAALFSAGASVAAHFYVGGGGIAVPIRVIRSQPDQLVGFGDGEMVMASNTLDIQRADIAAPGTGDEVQLYLDPERTVAGDRLRLAGAARSDAEGLTWYCPAELI